MLIAAFAVGRYVRAAVSAEDLEGLLNEGLVGATDGLYTVALERIEWGSTGVSPRLHGVSVMLDREVLAARDAAGTLPSVIFQLQHATVDVVGVDPWTLIRGNGLRAYALEIDGPLIQLSGLEDLIVRGRAAADPEAESVQAEVAPVVHQPEPEPAIPDDGEESPPRVRILRVRLNDADLESYRRQEADTGDIRDTFQLYESFVGVNIAFDDLDFTNPDPNRLLFSDDVRIEVAEYYYLWPDGLHEERHGPIRFSTGEGSVEIHNFSMTPLFDRRDEVAENGEAPRSRTVTIREASILGVDFDQLLADRAFEAETMRMLDADVDLVSDLPTSNEDVPSASGDVTAALTGARPGALLTEILGGLPRIDVERLVVENGNFELLVDRDTDGSWHDTPVRYHGIDDLSLELSGYSSGPGVEFDPARPLFADGWSVGASAITVTVGGGTPHRVQMNGWRSSSAGADLVVDSLQLEPVFDRREMETELAEPPDAHTLQTGSLSLAGINYGSLIESVDVEVQQITIVSPDLRTTKSEGTENPSPVRPEMAGRLPAETISAILVGFPSVSVGDVLLQDARWEMNVDRVDGEWLAEPVRRVLVDDVDMNLNLLSHEAGAGYEPGRYLLSETAEASIGTLVFAPGDGFEQLTVSGISASSDREELSIESVAFAPIATDRPTLVDRVQERSLANITTGRTTLEGRVLGDYVDTGEWALERLEIMSPSALLYETVRPAAASDSSADSTNTDGLVDVLAAAGLIHIDEILIRNGIYERRQAALGYDWEEIPPPVETIQNLNVTIRGFNTDPELGARRLLLSESVEVTAEEVATPLGEAGGTLSLQNVELSSDEATLRIGGAALTTRSVEGDNDFQFGAMELDNVPYGRLFRSLVEPRYRGTTPVIAAMVDRDLRLRIASLDGQLDDGARSLRLGRIEGAAATGTMAVEGLDFGPAARDADPSTAEIELADQEFIFRTASVDLTGVDYVALAETGNLVASSLEVAPPLLAVVRGLTVEDPTADAQPVETDLAESPTSAIRRAMEGFPVVAIDRLRVDDMTLQELRTLRGTPAREFSDISLAIDGLDLRPDRAPDDPEGLLYARDIRLNMPAQRTWLDNTGYEVAFGPIAISTGRRSVDLGSVGYVPPFDDAEFLNRTAIREGDRVEVTAGSLRLDEIDLDGFLNDKKIEVGTVTLADWQVSILSDKQKPRNPNPGIAWYPHENVQSMGLEFAVDEVVLQNGGVRYSERHREGERVGSIWWDRMQGRLTNLSNDPDRMTLETPAVLAISARMLDEAFLNLEWRLPLLEPGPTMSYSGEMSPLTASKLTSILEPLEGMRITEGIVDQATFSIDITNSHATGEFVALYRDLGIQFVDRNSGGRNVGRRLLSFAAGVIMPHNNRDAVGKPARVGKIDWVPAPEDPFFKVFWAAVRQGVLDLVLP